MAQEEGVCSNIQTVRPPDEVPPPPPPAPLEVEGTQEGDAAVETPPPPPKPVPVIPAKNDKVDKTEKRVVNRSTRNLKKAPLVNHADAKKLLPAQQPSSRAPPQQQQQYQTMQQLMGTRPGPSAEEVLSTKLSPGAAIPPPTTAISKDDVNAAEEKVLRELPYYHGYLAREDLSGLLKEEGDFLIRMTEVEENKEGTKLKRELVLSVFASADVGEDNEVSIQASTTTTSASGGSKVRNLVARRNDMMYRVEANKPFRTVRELIDYYHKNRGQVNKTIFLLTHPIGQQPWEYRHTHLVFTGKILGEGAYGICKQGMLNASKRLEDGWKVPIAVKLAKGTGTMSKAKIKELMREARLMRQIGSHPNVVRLYGVAVLEHPLYIILELINGGELRKYLKNNKTPLQEKLNMCLQAAVGINYLHTHLYIHRDIAARNCLYTTDKVVKISDFGLTRNKLEYKVRSNMKLPIKWLAPETIATLIFSTKSDVYAYGILVFEVFADGLDPWHGIQNPEVKKAVAEGRFLELPDNCPVRLKAFIKDAVFTREATTRATMQETLSVVETVVADPSAPPLPPRPNAQQKKFGFLKIFKRTG